MFHTVVIVGSSLLASCGKSSEQTAPAAGSSAKPADAAAVQPADAEAVAPADAAIDAAPIDAGVPDAAPAPKKQVPVTPLPPKIMVKPPSNHVRIMARTIDPPNRPIIIAPTSP